MDSSYLNKLHSEFNSSVEGTAFLPEANDLVKLLFKFTVQRTVRCHMEILQKSINETFTLMKCLRASSMAIQR
jgi:hypothetical protein